MEVRRRGQGTAGGSVETVGVYLLSAAGWLKGEHAGQLTGCIWLVVEQATGSAPAASAAASWRQQAGGGGGRRAPVAWLWAWPRKLSLPALAASSLVILQWVGEGRLKRGISGGQSRRAGGADCRGHQRRPPSAHQRRRRRCSAPDLRVLAGLQVDRQQQPVGALRPEHGGLEGHCSVVIGSAGKGRGLGDVAAGGLGCVGQRGGVLGGGECGGCRRHWVSGHTTFQKPLDENADTACIRHTG